MTDKGGHRADQRERGAKWVVDDKIIINGGSSGVEAFDEGDHWPIGGNLADVAEEPFTNDETGSATAALITPD